MDKKTNRHAVRRTVYTDEDAHKLVDIVSKYQHIVESKKTDVITWKEKDAAWKKVCDEYNSGQLDTRTVDQLRNKFDNLKKETRRYFAKQRQDLYRTGGGVPEDNVRALLKLLYNKITAIINLSVLGLEAFSGDSDMIATDNLVCDNAAIESAAAVEILTPVAECSNETVNIIEDTPIVLNIDPTDVVCSDAGVNDWSFYSPAMLKTKKHKSLTAVNHKANQKGNMSQTSKVLEGITNAKTELAVLKKELLLKEDVRNEEFHEAKLSGQQLLNEQLTLKNKILKLQLQKLEKEINDS